MANEENKKPSLTDKLKEGKEKLKEGVSVHDIETYAKKYSTEVFLIIAIVLAMIFSIFGWSFTSSNWGIFLAGIGALLGLLIPEQVGVLVNKILEFGIKKEKSTMILIGIIRILVAIIIPALIFGIFGLVAGHRVASYSKKS